MDAFWKRILWQQFGATIDMLENAVCACPEKLWSDPSKKPEWVHKDVVGFWYLAFHTLFWLDFYLSESEEGFAPPAPFTLDEFDPAGLLPSVRIQRRSFCAISSTAGGSAGRGSRG